MNKFQAWMYNFMQGRYGLDDLGRTLFTGIIVVLIISIVANLLGHFGGNLFYIVSSVTNALSTILIIYAFFRILSKNHEARRKENERFLKRRRKASNQKEYKYLKCPHCQQEMRVPRGKGKIAVKCPKCGESTITKS